VRQRHLDDVVAVSAKQTSTNALVREKPSEAGLRRERPTIHDASTG